MAVQISSGGDELVDINTTPLIDVMLVLIIMLIITIPIQTHAVKLDMPQAQPDKPEDIKPVKILVEIDFDGTILWDGQIIASRGQLQQFLIVAAGENPQPELHIFPNKLARYEDVAYVLGDAQRLGIKKIGFVGNERFYEE